MSDPKTEIGHKNRLVLLPVDPFLVHAYWEIEPAEPHDVQQDEEPGQPVLRFYRTGKARSLVDWFDIEVDLRSRSWYLHLWSPEQSLYADLALRKKDGTLLRLARSLTVSTPRTVPAVAVDPHFAQPADAPPLPVVSTQDEPLPPQQNRFVASHQLAVRSSPSNTIASTEMVRVKLKTLYDSLRLRRHDHVIEPEVPAAAAITTVRSKADLTTLAERNFPHNLSSSSLQKNPDNSKYSSKR